MAIYSRAVCDGDEHRTRRRIPHTLQSQGAEYPRKMCTRNWHGKEHILWQELKQAV